MNRRKQLYLVTAFTVMITVASALALGGKSGDRNATGTITQLVVSGATATVNGRTEKGALYLGYTVKWKDGLEKDYNPVRVKGKFTQRLSFQLRPQGVEKVTVALWRYKISSKRCAKDNGAPCKYCRKNGYHMEGRIANATGN